MPPVAVHFNGGVNLPDTMTVLRTLAERVPQGVRRLPDGETGERAQWIGCQRPRLQATPGLEMVEAAPESDGQYGAGPTFRLADRTDPDTIVWPDLGYATEYEASCTTFRRLRADAAAAGPGAHRRAGRVEDRAVTEPAQLPPHQGDVLVSSPSPLTGERELYTVVSADIYNTAGGPTVLVAEIGEYFGQLTDTQGSQVINQIAAVLRGH